MQAKFPEIICDAHPDWVELYRLTCSPAPALEGRSATVLPGLSTVPGSNDFTI